VIEDKRLMHSTENIVMLNNWIMIQMKLFKIFNYLNFLQMIQTLINFIYFQLILNLHKESLMGEAGWFIPAQDNNQNLFTCHDEGPLVINPGNGIIKITLWDIKVI
jgi:hypothetical protein